jgi:tetratricopeptide (TPR) repeat protein
MESIHDLIATGKQAFEGKEYVKAEECLRKVVQRKPNYADVLNLLGVIHHIEGKFSSSISFFEKALTVNPQYTEALLNLAVLYNDLGRYDDAKKLYKKLRTKKETTHKHIEPVLKGRLSNLHADIGDIYRNLGLNTEAIEEYSKALNLNPKYIDIRTRLAISLREHKEYETAVKELKKVLKQQTAYTDARIQLGVTYYSMGKMAQAKKEWKKVIENDPENESARMYLSLCEQP